MLGMKTLFTRCDFVDVLSDPERTRKLVQWLFRSGRLSEFCLVRSIEGVSRVP